MLSNIANRIFPSEADALRPRLACEITSAGVVAGRPGDGEQEIVSGFAPLRPGVLAAGLKPPNFTDRAAVASALRQALDEISVKEGGQITVVIPDVMVTCSRWVGEMGVPPLLKPYISALRSATASLASGCPFPAGMLATSIAASLSRTESPAGSVLLP